MEELTIKPVVVEGFLTVGSCNEKKVYLRIRKNEIWGNSFGKQQYKRSYCG